MRVEVSGVRFWGLEFVWQGLGFRARIGLQYWNGLGSGLHGPNDTTAIISRGGRFIQPTPISIDIRTPVIIGEQQAMLGGAATRLRRGSGVTRRRGGDATAARPRSLQKSQKAQTVKTVRATNLEEQKVWRAPFQTTMKKTSGLSIKYI